MIRVRRRTLARQAAGWIIRLVALGYLALVAFYYYAMWKRRNHEVLF